MTKVKKAKAQQKMTTMSTKARISSRIWMSAVTYVANFMDTPLSCARSLAHDSKPAHAIASSTMGRARVQTPAARPPESSAGSSAGAAVVAAAACPSSGISVGAATAACVT